MRVKVAAAAMAFWLITVGEAFAFGWSGGAGKGIGGSGTGGSHAAPEIDGPGGVAAIALLVSVGIIAYNRYRNK